MNAARLATTFENARDMRIDFPWHPREAIPQLPKRERAVSKRNQESILGMVKTHWACPTSSELVGLAEG